MPEETTTQAAEVQQTVGDPAPVVQDDYMSKFEFAEDQPSSMPDSKPRAEADEPEEEAPEVETKSDPETPKQEALSSTVLSEQDLARARQYGFTDSDIGRFKSADDLDLHIGFLARADQQRQAAYAQQQANQARQGQQQQPQQQAPQQGMPGQFQLQISDAVADEIIQPLQAMNEYYARQIAEAHQALGQVVNVLAGPIHNTIMEFQQAKAEQRLDRFDSFVSSLGEDWTDVFGQGSTYEMDTSSKEFQNRVKLIQASEDIANGRLMSAGERLSDAQRWKRGLGLEFGELGSKKAADSTKKKLAEQLTKNGKRIVSRPSGTRRPVTSSRFANLEAKMAELGITDDDEFE